MTQLHSPSQERRSRRRLLRHDALLVVPAGQSEEQSDRASTVSTNGQSAVGIDAALSSLQAAIRAIADPAEARCALLSVQDKLNAIGIGDECAGWCAVDQGNVEPQGSAPHERVTSELAGRSTIDAKLQNLPEWIGRNLDESLDDVSLADRAGMTVVSFRREFKKLVGVTPHKFVTHCRARCATSLVQQGIKHEAIARMIGFASKSSLYRALKRQADRELREMVSFRLPNDS